MGEKIGTFTLDAPTRFEVGQEYAGASREVEVPAGEYTMELCKTYGMPYVHVCMPATVTHDFFLNRVGAHTSPSTTNAVGKRTKHSLQLRDYAVAMAYAKGERVAGGRVELLDAWRAVPRGRIHLLERAD